MFDIVSTQFTLKQGDVQITQHNRKAYHYRLDLLLKHIKFSEGSLR